MPLLLLPGTTGLHHLDNLLPCTHWQAATKSLQSSLLHAEEVPLAYPVTASASAPTHLTDPPPLTPIHPRCSWIAGSQLENRTWHQGVLCGVLGRRE